MQLKNIHINLLDLLSLEQNCNVYCYDLNNHLLYVNDYLMGLLQQYGYKTRRDLYHKNILDKHPEFQHAQEENALVLKTKKAHQFFNKVAFKDTFVLLITIKTPTYNKKGKVNGVFGISQVISINTIKHMPNKLSKRQHECIFHMLKGKTNAQIAKAMNLSTRTVETYIDNVKDKLLCPDKNQLIDKILHSGLAHFEHKSISTNFHPGIFLQKDL